MTSLEQGKVFSEAPKTIGSKKGVNQFLKYPCAQRWCRKGNLRSVE